jgi:hypothetical protein
MSHRSEFLTASDPPFYCSLASPSSSIKILKVISTIPLAAMDPKVLMVHSTHPVGNPKRKV